MRRGWNPTLEARVRDPAGSARIIVELRNELGADIRQTPGQAFAPNGPLGWSESDTWSGIYPSTVQILSDGSLTGKYTASGAQGPSTQNSVYNSFNGGNLPGTFIDPFATLGIGPVTIPPGSNFIGIIGQWIGAGDPTVNNYGSAQAYLNPQVSPGTARTVTTWLLRIWQLAPIVSEAGEQDLIPTSIAWAIAQAPQAVGFVPFTFYTPFRPLPYDPSTGLTQYFFTINGFDGTGLPAENIGWGADSAHNTYSWGSTVIFQSGVAGFGPAPDLSNTIVVIPGGASLGIPTLQLFPAAASGTNELEFITGHPISLPVTPTSPPEVVLRGDVPAGCTLNCFIRPHTLGGSYYQVTDGQNTQSLVASGLPQAHVLDQVWDMIVDLNNSPDGTRETILSACGMRAVSTADLGDLARVSSWQERVDPPTHVSEIGQCTIEVLRDGERDYQDVITQVLANNPLGQLYFRVWMGDRTLSTPTNKYTNWMHIDDFLVDDNEADASKITVVGLSALALLKQALPKLAADAPAYPSTDDSNLGGFLVVGGVGSTLFPALADVAQGGPFGNPLDETYIYVVNPNTAQYSTKLTPVSAPPQALPNNVFIQARAALAAAGGITIEVQLYQGPPFGGGTLIATLQPTTISNVDTGEGSYQSVQYSLLAGEVASVTNWSNLYFLFTASRGVASTGTLRIGWARLVVTGTRNTLTYPSVLTPGSTIQTCAEDIIRNQVGLDTRYDGFGYQDSSLSPGPAIGVGKQISVEAGGSTALSKALDELNALMWIAGYALISRQGKIGAVALYNVATMIDPIWGNTSLTAGPLASTVRARFPLGEVVPISVTAGWRQRVPIFDVPFGYVHGLYSDNIQPGTTQGIAQYTGEQRGINSYVLNTIPPALIDVEQRCRDVAAQWIPTQSLANGLAIRHVTMFGVGMIEWRFRSTYRHPELEIGDLVVVATTDFVMFDPIANRALFGEQYATGVICGKWDAEGTEFSVWIQTPGNILRAIATSHAPGFVIPQGDLVLNPGFEQGLCYWGRLALANESMSLATTSPAPLKGTASLHLNVGSGHQGFVYQKTDPTNNLADNVLAPCAAIPVRPGQVVRLAALCYDNGTNAVNTPRFVGLVLLTDPTQLPNAAGGGIANILSWSGGTDTVVAQSAYYTIPAGVGAVVVVCGAKNLDGTQPDAYFDEIHMQFVGPGDVGSY